MSGRADARLRRPPARLTEPAPTDGAATAPVRPSERAVVAGMEAAFGRSFAGVRLRTDETAASRAEALGARAYTDGREIGFARGAYAPETAAGRHTIAHELAHVAQAGGGTAARGSGLGLGPVRRQAVGPAPTVEEVEAEAEAAADAVDAGEQPAVGAAVLDLALQKKSGPPPSAPPPGSFYVRFIDGEYFYTFNAEDAKRWDQPETTVFGFYLRDVFAATPDVAKEFLDYLADTTRPNRATLPASKIALDFNIKQTAQQHSVVGLAIRAKLHEAVVEWMREHYPRMAARQPSSGVRDLANGDYGQSDRSTKDGQGGGGKGDKRRGGEPAILRKTRELYTYLLQTYPTHAVFTEHAAQLEDLLQFLAIHPEAIARVPDPPKDLSPPPPAYVELLKSWLSFLVGRQRGPRNLPPGTLGAEERGSDRTSFVQFEPSAKLEVDPVYDRYVRESKITFRVQFANTNTGNYLLNFLPRKATFDWTIYCDGQVVDRGPVLGGIGEREYSVDLKRTGTYSATVRVSSASFKDGQVLNLDIAGLQVVQDVQRSEEVFNDQLADPKRADAPFVRDEHGKLKLKPGYVPLTPYEEALKLSDAIGRVKALKAQGRIRADHADQQIETLEEQRKVLLAVQEQERIVGKEYKRYNQGGTFVSRETSGTMRLRTIMHRLKRLKAPPKSLYHIETVDTTLNPSNPAYYQGEGEAPLNEADEAQSRRAAELDAIEKMMARWRALNEYPNGQIKVGIETLEGGQVVERSFDTLTGKKQVKKYLTIGMTAAGVVLLAASPLTAGTSAAVGVLILNIAMASLAIGMGVWEMLEQREREKGLKADKRLALNILQIVAAAAGLGGLAGPLRGAGTLLKGMYLGTVAGLDIGQGVLVAAEVQEQIAKIEADYAVRIAEEPENREKLKQERDMAIAQVLGGAAVNGAFMIVSIASHAHAISTVKGRASGRAYDVRPEIKELAAGRPDPNAIRSRLDTDRSLNADERAYLSEALLTTPPGRAETRGATGPRQPAAVAATTPDAAAVAGPSDLAAAPAPSNLAAAPPPAGAAVAPAGAGSTSVATAPPAAGPATVDASPSARPSAATNQAAAAPSATTTAPPATAASTAGGGSAPAAGATASVGAPAQASAGGGGRPPTATPTARPAGDAGGPSSTVTAAPSRPAAATPDVPAPPARPADKTPSARPPPAPPAPVRPPETRPAAAAPVRPAETPGPSPSRSADPAAGARAGEPPGVARPAERAPAAEDLPLPELPKEPVPGGGGAAGAEAPPQLAAGGARASETTTGGAKPPEPVPAGVRPGETTAAGPAGTPDAATPRRPADQATAPKPTEAVTPAGSIVPPTAAQEQVLRRKQELSQLLLERQQLQGRRSEIEGQLNKQGSSARAKAVELDQQASAAEPSNPKRAQELRAQAEEARAREAAARATLDELGAQETAANEAIGAKRQQILAAEIEANPEKHRGKLPCFAAGTPVWTVDGQRRIEDLAVGDMVLGYDFERGRVVDCAVVERFVNRTLHFYEVVVGGQVLRATGRHPFWAECRREWVAASALSPGLRLRLTDGRSEVVERVTLREVPESPTYNLRVDQTSTYFVGPGVLVHNDGPVNLGLGNEWVIYRATNEAYPNEVYIGRAQVTTVKGPHGAAGREPKHQGRAVKQLQLHNERAIDLSPEGVKFYEFMREATLTEIVTGIGNKDQAILLEQRNIELERKAAKDPAMVRNRREEIGSEERLNEIEQRVANDPAVQKAGFCPLK